MTSRHPRSIAQRRCRHRAGAFTLVELLTVIFIIAILMALLVPLVARAVKSSGKIRIQADYQTIGLALDAYKQAFGDIPRIPTRPDGTPIGDTGAAILGKALIGPYGDGLLPSGGPDTTDPPNYQSAVGYKAGEAFQYGGSTYLTLQEAAPGTAASNANYFLNLGAAPNNNVFSATDGADGPGFRLRKSTTTNIPQGQVYGPYLQIGKINTRGMCLLDHYGGPILYFPASPKRGNLSDQTANNPKAYIDQGNGTKTSYYNVDDNIQALRRLDPIEADSIPCNRMRMMFGDYDLSGYVNDAETVLERPYVLWSPGADGIFGPPGFKPTTGDTPGNKKAFEHCDDVLNNQ